MGGISTANQQYIGPAWNSRLDSRINCRDVLPLSLTYVTNPYPPSATRANLITIPRQIMPNIRKQTSEFVVPKFLLTNICSLAKTKNRVRAVVALETDLRRKDIDVCIVSETHLKTNIPNSAVDIHNYDIYRRDRNWSGMDKRAKGGIAIYVRKNLDIVDVYRSSLYELIYLVVRLPSGHMLVVCGFYHPPRPTYQVKDLMIYLVDFMDNILDKFPGGVIVPGGDVNRLDPDELCSMTGWKALVSFPTRGDSILDNVFTNRSDLFGKCKPDNITTKTDHTAVILPPGTKLKPIRRKVQIRDCRKHRKECLYKSLAGENWGAVLNTNDVDQAVSNLEKASDSCSYG